MLLRLSPHLLLFHLVTTCLVSLIFIPARAASLESLGDLAGGSINSNALGVSADGSVVVGTSSSTNGSEAFRWTQNGGMVGLGYLPGGSSYSFALGVSANASVIVGQSESANGFEAFRWTQSGGMIGLGFLPGGSFYSVANDVSADGSVVVGESASPNGNEAFRWTQATGMVGLGDLPGGNFYSTANDVSANGAVVVGQSESANGIEAFRWTQATGMVGLGDLAGGVFYSAATGVSADGSVIIGSSDSANSNGTSEAFRWTQATGMVGLGDLPGGGFLSEAKGVNANGSVVVGRSDSANGTEAFRWTQATGMVSLKDMLNNAGVDTNGWFLSEANDVSADGNIIVGNGVFNGDTVGYLANVATGGLTTPQALGESLNTVAQAGQQTMTATARYLPQTLFIAQHIDQVAVPAFSSSYGGQTTPYGGQSFASIEPAAGGSLGRSRLSAFMLGGYGFDDDPRSDQFNGTVGINIAATENVNIGVGMIGGTSSTDLLFDGKSDLNALGGTIIASYQPDEPGLRLYGAAYVARLNLDMTRGYLNGSGLDFSNGETDGMSYGAAVRIGWEKNIVNRETTLMPYIEGRYSKTKIDGYTEQGGAFAATFSDQDNDQVSSRIGVELKHDLNDKVQVLFRPAWGHRFNGDGDGFTANVSGLTQTLKGDAGDRDWAEATIGGTWRMNDRVHFTTELTGRTGDTAEPLATLMIGVFVKF